jgi:L-ascorbate metabolism protein UlaG (beta-lactamase superfamily)
LEITYFGQSTFRLRGKEVTVVTDPAPNGRASTDGLGADIFTVSAPGSERGIARQGDDGARLVSGPGEYEIADILVHGVATSLEPFTGAVNTAFVFRIEDLVVCHLGNTREKLSDQQVEDIGNIDVLLVPVGADGALEPGQAAQVVSQLEPMVVVPMGYAVNGELPEPVKHFCGEMGSKDVAPEPKLTLTKNSLPSQVRVVVLENREG